MEPYCSPSRSELLLVRQLQVTRSYQRLLTAELLRVSSQREAQVIRDAIARLETPEPVSALVAHG
jgi:hypothetical protein